MGFLLGVGVLFVLFCSVLFCSVCFNMALLLDADILSLSFSFLFAFFP